FLGSCPVRTPVVVNYIAATILETHKALANASVNPYEIDWEEFLVNAAVELMGLKILPAGLEQYKLEILAATDNFDTRDRINKIFDRNGPSRFKRSLTRFIRQNEILSRLEVI